MKALLVALEALNDLRMRLAHARQALRITHEGELGRADIQAVDHRDPVPELFCCGTGTLVAVGHTGRQGDTDHGIPCRNSLRKGHLINIGRHAARPGDLPRVDHPPVQTVRGQRDIIQKLLIAKPDRKRKDMDPPSLCRRLADITS